MRLVLLHKTFERCPSGWHFSGALGEAGLALLTEQRGKATVGKAADVNLFPCSFSIAINTEELYSKWCILSECLQCCLPHLPDASAARTFSLSVGWGIHLPVEQGTGSALQEDFKLWLWQLFPIYVASVWRLWFQVALGNNRCSKGQGFSLLTLLVARAHSLSF